MLLELLSQYLKGIRDAVRGLPGAYVEFYEEEVVSANRINLRIRIRFSSKHLLELNVATVIEEGRLSRLTYRYHFQDRRNNLVFRYDNTPHFPALKTFPHHKHLQEGVTYSEGPSVLSVIEEAKLKSQERT